MPKGIFIHKKGWKHTLKTKIKIGKANSISLLGKTRPQKVKDKIRATNLKLGRRIPIKYGKEHPGWKGDKVSYSGLHYWVVSKLGKPNECQLCKVAKRGRYEWANKSHQYKRKTSDWIRLSVSCHRKYDKNTNSKKYYAKNI